MQSDRTTLRRKPDRAAYDAPTVHAILDGALFCHLGFAQGGQPYVIPTLHARVGDRLYLHGAVANRMLRVLAGGAPCCVTATLLDGLVLARSAFHHSVNYRSAVVLGRARDVTAPVVPLRLAAATPVPDARTRDETAFPHDLHRDLPDGIDAP